MQLARAAVAKSMMWQPGGEEGGREGGKEEYGQIRTGIMWAWACREGGREGGEEEGGCAPAFAIAIADAIEAPLVSWVWKWTGRDVTSLIACMRGAAARGFKRPAMSWLDEGKGGKEEGRVREKRRRE